MVGFREQFEGPHLQKYSAPNSEIVRRWKEIAASSYLVNNQTIQVMVIIYSIQELPEFLARQPFRCNYNKK